MENEVKKEKERAILHTTEGNHIDITEALEEIAEKRKNRFPLPANLDDATLSRLEAGLVNSYKNQNRAAGTYVKHGPIWTRE